MLRIRIILIFILLGQTNLKAQTFDISIDTMYVDLTDIAAPASVFSLTHAVKLNDTYYCFFRQNGLYGYHIEHKYFLIISNKGAILQNIKVPKEIDDDSYFDFFIRDGSLIIRTYYDERCFKLDLKKLKWKRIKFCNNI